jgi:glycosyltransferase involved in cell wall biosynthesis
MSAQQPPRIAQTVHSLRTDHGGPSRSVTALSGALARAGATVEIVSRDAPDTPTIAPEAPVTVRRIPADGPVRALLGRNAALDAALGAADLVHDHGLWLPVNHAACAAARRAGRPLVISPRGMLSAWALNHKRQKKQAVWHLYQRTHLTRAALLHATAESEADDIRDRDLRAPIVILPNGVDLPPPPVTRPASPDRRRRALFLSRLHPKKGLLHLVRAWAEAAPPDWELVLAGPEEDGHWTEVQRVAAEVGARHVSWIGEVPDAEKWDLYQSADLFVLPTFSENFGIVVAEALAAGVPAIVTRGAPWAALDIHRCGWWIDIGVEPLAATLAEATGATDTARTAMGARGRAYVEEALSWDALGRQMLDAYAWVLGHGPKPAHVHTT